jgi:diaminohydroxyphosphoribosylaminopyrimidine deaminase / 5-amino-6-(5-phosphoribosylamino)uracil reductase
VNQDQQYMKRAMELAELGRGQTSPNPLVGCVIVHEGEIIGEGYHRKYGEAHAEPNAIASVKEKHLLPNSTFYVTLEPCAHFGKTPPCASLLVEWKVKKVVIGATDTNPLVGGKGINLLKSAGIEVITGVLEKEIRIQNQRFFTFMEKKRPYLILKWAQSKDGFIARENFDSKWISNPYSRQWVHKWRSEEDAIMVGKNTALYDNPKLNVREWSGKNPTRVVIDKDLTLTEDLHVFDRSQPTLIYNKLKNQEDENLTFVQISNDFQTQEIIQDLYERKIQSVFIEGGSFLMNKLIENELWDEARVFTGSVSFGKGVLAPKINGLLDESFYISDDKLEFWKNKQ